MTLSSLLAKIEENYVFRLSRGFWHVLIGLATLAAVAALLALAWAYLPAQKQNVQKAPYPAPVSVSLDEVKTKLKPVPADKTAEAPASAQAASTNTPSEPDDKAGHAAYLKAFEALKQLMPANKFSWKDAGKWEYPYGQFMWDYYQDPDYRRWVITQKGIPSLLDERYAAAGADTFALKAQLLEAYNATLTLIPLGDRQTAFNTLGALSNGGTDRVANDLTSVNRTVSLLSSKRVTVLGWLVNLISEDGERGRSLVDGLGNHLDKFASTARLDVIDAFFSSYYQKFDGSYEQQQEALEGFLPMLPQLAANEQAKALNTYFDLFVSKNVARQQAIGEINSRYDDALAKAEADYTVMQANKETSRPFAWYALGGGLATAAFFALFLVLLSIQRHLKALLEVSQGLPANASLSLTVPNSPESRSEPLGSA